MRRTTSALTTTILGAALAASAVSAQQILPSASARRGDSAASASESTPAPGSTSTSNPEAGPGTNTDPIVGMAATRGARYLLRNGLDYINYQEYERALKYLREAETRKQELNNSERRTLKQAIERAQRGLREAVGSEAPYALSQRTRRPGGFSPARPDTQTAAKPSVSPPQGREPLVRTPNREGDDQGQPIRLTGAEIASPIPSPSPASATPAPVSGEMPQLLPIAADQPAQLSGMSKLPSATGSPKAIAEEFTKIADPPPQPAADSTTLASTPAAKPKPDAAVAAQADLLSPLPPVTPVSGAQTGAQKPDLPQPTATVAAVANTVELQPQASAPPADTNAAPPLEGSAPAPAPSSAAVALPTAPESVQLAPVPPTQSAQPGPVSDAMGAKPPVTVDANAIAASTPRAPESVSEQPAATPAPISPEQPTDPAAKPASPSDPPSNDLDSVPLPPLGSESDKPKNSTSRTAKDSSPTTAEPGRAPDTPSATTSTPPPVTASEDLPPLPQQTARESEPKRDDAKAKAPATE
ncbi:MAG: hypothetical protein JO344_00085, partial [Planctomycetaceae bacterium]|nr:hypothetical protein [Planctomycetaceae bacterium]